MNSLRCWMPLLQGLELAAGIAGEAKHQKTECGVGSLKVHRWGAGGPSRCRTCLAAA